VAIGGVADGGLSPLPESRVPVTKHRSQDDALAEVARALRDAVRASASAPR
jgi:hypothetical protein